MKILASNREKNDPAEAERQAERLRADPAVRRWLARCRKLMRAIPEGTHIYWQEGDCNLLAKSPEGYTYMTTSGGRETRAVIGSVDVPGSDCGGW